MEGLRSSQQTVRFGPFELDPAAGELRKSGAKVRLQEQPLQVLQILLEVPGKLITREELQQRIWPSDTFVDFDHGINNAIKRLREALDDSAETPRFIETLPRRGYRFKASVKGGSCAGFSSLSCTGRRRLSMQCVRELLFGTELSNPSAATAGAHGLIRQAHSNVGIGSSSKWSADRAQSELIYFGTSDARSGRRSKKNL